MDSHIHHKCLCHLPLRSNGAVSLLLIVLASFVNTSGVEYFKIQSLALAYALEMDACLK